MSRRNQCAVCTQELLPGQELYCCTNCGGIVHRKCSIEAEQRCPNCANPIPADLVYLPETTGLKIALAVTGGLAAILFLIAAAVLFQIPFGPDAPGTAGVAFYFVFLPIGTAALLILGVFALVWSSRSAARKPQRLKASV